MWRGLIVTALVLALAATAAFSGSTPGGKWNEFPQFRHVSALPGNAFGVTADGLLGFDGALQQNIPVAYTPSWGQYIAGYWSGSNSSSIEIGTSGGNVNGTGLVGIGLGKPETPVYLGVMFVDTTWRSAYNIQVQLQNEKEHGIAVALGVNDIESQQQAVGGVGHGARSIYVTATKKTGSAEKPVYLTLGAGGGRFDSGPFGGVSWSFADRFTACLEHDGLNTNAGLAFGLKGRQAADKKWDGVAYLGWAGLERPVIGAAFTYRR
jgi:hypothetical protein